MPKLSAGLLMYRVRDDVLEVLLAHPGGPLWARKDLGVWTVPKGEVESGEDQLATARREFEEELGFTPSGEFIALGTITQKSGKIVRAWAFEGNCDSRTVKSNTFSMEWPPGSGNRRDFPEIDRAEFFTVEEARKRIKPAQIPLLERLEEKLRSGKSIR